MSFLRFLENLCLLLRSNWRARNLEVFRSLIVMTTPALWAMLLSGRECKAVFNVLHVMQLRKPSASREELYRLSTLIWSTYRRINPRGCVNLLRLWPGNKEEVMSLPKVLTLDVRYQCSRTWNRRDHVGNATRSSDGVQYTQKMEANRRVPSCYAYYAYDVSFKRKLVKRC